MNTASFKEKLFTALRRPQVWGFFVSIAVMAVVAVAFFAPDNVEGNSLQQHDMQQGAANGEETRAWQELTGQKALWTNALFSGMPTFQISPSYPSNDLFTWLNDVYGLGLPSPSNLLFMMMFGMLILCYCCRMRWWYALIAAVAWGLSSYFIIIIGAGHIWKFITLTYVPPTIGAMLLVYRRRYVLGGALLALFAMLQLNANHPQITYYSAFIMGAVVIALLIAAIRHRQIRGWLASTVMCLFAGAVAIGANAPALYNTYEYSKETKRSQSELTPLNSQEKSDAGSRPTGGLPKEEIGGWSNTPSESFSLLIPDIKGGATIRPEKGSNVYLPLSETDAYKENSSYAESDIFGLIPQLSRYFGGKGMTNGPFYMGALICALFLLGCIIVRGPVKWALLSVTVFSILLAMGNHFEALTDFMIYNVPLYNKFRAAETALVIAALCMPLLGAMALQKLFTTEHALRVYRIPLAVAFGIPVLICLVAVFFPQAFGQPFSAEETAYFDANADAIAAQGPVVQEAFRNTLDNIAALRFEMVSSDALRSLLVLVCGFAAIFMACAGVISAAVGAVAVGAVILVDLYTVDKRYVNTESFAEQELVAADPLAADAIDRSIMADTAYYRVADLTAFGDARRSFYHHMVGGYHAAKLNRYNDLIERRMQHALGMQGQYIPEVRTDSLRNIADPKGAEFFNALCADYRVLDMLNTRYIITNKGLVRNDHAAGPGWMADSLIYVDNADAEMAALGKIDPTAVAVADRRFSDALGGSVPSTVPGDTVILDKYAPDRLTYTTVSRNGGVAVFSEIWFPWGWNAEIDGQPATLGRVNYVLRALRVPAGRHTVTMTFDPQSIHTTSTVAYICVTLIYLLLALALFTEYTGLSLRRRKK